MTAIPPARHDGARRFTVITVTGFLAAEVARALANELTGLAAAAFAVPPWNETPAHARQVTGQMLADAGHPAFVLALAFTGNGPALAGFGYGIPRWPRPGIAGGALAYGGAEPFELCELAVRPAARGQGAGRALHDAIVAASGPQPRWLVTHPAARPAVGLYRATGWHARRLFPSRADSGTRLLMTRSR
jgi:GNAT superfamily N-acetyltransferase